MKRIIFNEFFSYFYFGLMIIDFNVKNREIGECLLPIHHWQWFDLKATNVNIVYISIVVVIGEIHWTAIFNVNGLSALK